MIQPREKSVVEIPIRRVELAATIAFFQAAGAPNRLAELGFSCLAEVLPLLVAAQVLGELLDLLRLRDFHWRTAAVLVFELVLELHHQLDDVK